MLCAGGELRQSFCDTYHGGVRLRAERFYHNENNRFPGRNGGGPLFGKIMAKKHMHAVWVGSLLGVTAVFTRMSFASTLPQFYIISFIQGLFTTSAAMLPVNIVLTNWFRKKRGFIVSIAMAGSGIGGTVLSRLMGTMIVEHGWRYTYRFLALLILCILVPAVGLVIRRTPVEKGLKPYGKRWMTP